MLDLFKFSLKEDALEWFLTDYLSGVWKHGSKRFKLSWIGIIPQWRSHGYEIKSITFVSLKMSNDARTRFNILLWQSSLHGLTIYIQLPTFFKFVNEETQKYLNSCTTGSFMRLLDEDALELLHGIVSSHTKWRNVNSCIIESENPVTREGVHFISKFILRDHEKTP